MSEVKADTVPGLGFKDKEKAMETIRNLEGRDPDYQKLAIKGLIGRAKRVLTLTKDKDKLQNIKDAMKTFEDWLKDYEKNNTAKENRPYLPLETVRIISVLKGRYNVEDKKAEEFVKAYKSVKGEYKNLRTKSSGEDEPTWDIVRNTHLKPLVKKIDEDDVGLWNEDDLPTKEHLEMILWAYSPDASKIKKGLSKLEEKLGNAEDEEEEDEMDEESDGDENGDAKKSRKRKSDGSSDENDAESPKKKSKD